MEKTHRGKLQRKFRGDLKSARIICLSIPDDYAFMVDGLLRLLRAKVEPHLPWKQPCQVVSEFSLATAPSPPHIRA
ncbi:hypothetical protein [Croceicoccus marinus]|uniref:hypothetical protein n=1 Tax=Croceicoccus marinus TaxID=450378 RepID=UPI002FCA7883